MLFFVYPFWIILPNSKTIYVAVIEACIFTVRGFNAAHFLFLRGNCAGKNNKPQKETEEKNMKLKKIAASIVAAAVAFSTVAYSSIAEEVKSEKIALVTSELKTEIKSDLVFIEGIGVVDTTGVGIASSENGSADEDANLDVSFDDIGYISQESLKAWKETGELKVEKLKADFDTTGLKWGMFNGANGYVQLVKMEKQKVENSEEEEDVVIYRGLYKIENGEIKHLCDLDTSWTYSREDGISIGFKTLNKDITLLKEKSAGDIYDDGEETDNISCGVEFRMIVTQPDGNKNEVVIAKAENIPDEIEIPVVYYDEDMSQGFYDYNVLDTIFECYGRSWSVPIRGDIYANVCSVKSPCSNWVYMAGGWSYELGQVDKDGNYKKIYSETSVHEDGFGTGADFGGILWGDEGTIVWWDDAPPAIGSTTLHGYNAKTGKVESYGSETFDYSQGSTDGWFYSEEDDYPSWLFDIKYYSEKCTIATIDVTASIYVPDENNPDDPKKPFDRHGTYKDVVLADGYIVLDNFNDFKNWQSKTCYEDIDVNLVGDSVILKYTTKDGKTGFMDENEKILGEFDALDNFAGDYAPVVKNGKAYLVDKDMNTVSTEIEADDVIAIDEDLFLAKSGDKTYFVTYQNEEKEPEDSSDSETSSDSEASSDSETSSDTETSTDSETSFDNSTDSETSTDSNSSGSGATSPDTGVAGISLTLGIVALAGAAVVISRKKR